MLPIDAKYFTFTFWILEEDDFEDRCQELMEKKERMLSKFELLTYKEAMVIALHFQLPYAVLI